MSINLPDWYEPEIMERDERTGRWVWRLRPLSYFRNARTCIKWNNRHAGQTITPAALEAHIRRRRT